MEIDLTIKLLYASDYDAQKDIPLSFYDEQRKKFHSGEKDNDYDKGFEKRLLQIRDENLHIIRLKNEEKKTKKLRKGKLYY